MSYKILKLGALGVVGIFAIGAYGGCIFTVEPGHTALKLSRIKGLGDEQYREGIHFRLPYVETPIIFNTQARAKSFQNSVTNTDLMNVNMTVRVLFQPIQEELPQLYRQIGTNYDEIVLPSLMKEIMSTVIAKYSTRQILNQRDKISEKIKKDLEERAKAFHIDIKDIAIVELTCTQR